MISKEEAREETVEGGDSQRWTYAGIAVLGVALCLRLLGLNKGLWMDETYSMKAIAWQTLRGMLRSMRWDDQPPLYYLILRFWSMLSTNEAMLRLLSVVFGLAAILCLIYLMKQYSRSAALLAALVLATFPLALRYSQEIRPYALLLFATALAFYFASRILAHPGRNVYYLGLGVSLSVAVLTHLLGILVPIPVFLFLVVRNPRWRSISLPASVVVLASVTALFCIVRYYYLVGVERVTSNWWMPPISLTLFGSVMRNATGMPSAQSQAAGTTLDLLTQGGTLLAFVTLAVSALLGDWKRTLPFSIAAFAYWMELVAYSVMQKPVFMDRTVLAGLVPFSGFVGLQVVTISKRWVRITAIGALLLMACCFATRWAVRGAWKPVEETRTLSELFDSQRSEHNLVIIYPDYYEVPLLYYARPIPDEDKIGISIREPAGETRRAIEGALSGQAGVHASRPLFLMIRVDMLTLHDTETYEELFSVVESHRTEIRALHLFLMNSPEGGREMFDKLCTRLGQPVSTQDFGTFLYALFEPKRAR